MATGSLDQFPFQRSFRTHVSPDGSWDHRVGRNVPSTSQSDQDANLDATKRSPDPDAAPSFDNLTKREWAVLWLLTEGLSDRDIAVRLNIGRETVRTYMAGLLKKLGAESRLEALVIAVRHGKVTIPKRAPD